MGAEMTNLSFTPIYELDKIPEHHIQQAIKIYQCAFENPPYCELFSSDEAQSALQFILDKDGDLILGAFNDKIVSLAGGYFNEPYEYFVEELAVDPDVQGKGFGRATLRSLIEMTKDQNA